MGIYEKYFFDKDVSVAETQIMHDIRNCALRESEFHELLEELELHGHLRTKDFRKKPQSQWNEDYIKLLSRGNVSDLFSREYLTYFDEVARYVANRKSMKDRRNSRTWFLIGAVIVMIILIAVIVFVSGRG